MIRPLYIEDFSFACSLGQSKETVWSKLINGQRECFNQKDFLGTPYYIAELNPEIKLPQITDPFFDGSINRISQAILNPMQDSIQRCINHYGKDRIAIVIGSCDNGSEASLNALSYYKEHNQFPKGYTLDQQRADSPCVYIAKTYGITGIKMSVSTACSSGGSAFATARNLIYAGLCDAAIVGGIDITSLPVVLGFASLEAVSPEPCNPFSKNRKGITLGNGGAYFIVTKDISDNTLLRIRGIGESADADHLTHPQPEGIGAKKAMLNALTDADLSSEDIDYLNLHGTGTPLNDSMESIAVNDVFPKSIPVSSTKALTGHTLGGAAALELAFAALTLSQKNDNSFLPVHLWDKEYDSNLPKLHFVEKGFKATRLNTIMSNSFGFGGCNVSLIMDKINS